MKITRRISRRSFLARVSGGAIGAGSFLTLTGCATASTDADPYDPVGGGRRGRGGYTDADTGPYADPSGRGRGRGGITDGDTGRYADPAGRGRSGACSDTDTGRHADPIGRGRRC
ncbi:MAG: hypothetical protein ABR601_07430 [Parasphingopyxis sp.]